MSRYPTYSKELRFALEPGKVVDATVDMDGRCVVTLHEFSNRFDDMTFHPHEAERLGLALIEAANVARSKREWAKADRKAATP
jgi:hypothetical protein